MIEIYTGAVGSGKSYHALFRGLQKTKAYKNNFVVANFPCRYTEREKKNGIHKRWIYLDDEDLKPETLIQLSLEKGWFGHESSCLLIVDEAGVYFNARDWQVSGQVRKTWIKFFAQSRKFGYDVILIAQDARMIDRQIRTIAEYTVKHVKLRNYKWFKLLPVQLFACVSFWAGGSFRGSLQLVLYKPWIARRYDTMRIFDLSMIAEEVIGKKFDIVDTSRYNVDKKIGGVDDESKHKRKVFSIPSISWWKNRRHASLARSAEGGGEDGTGEAGEHSEGSRCDSVAGGS